MSDNDPVTKGTLNATIATLVIVAILFWLLLALAGFFLYIRSKRLRKQLRDLESQHIAIKNRTTTLENSKKDREDSTRSIPSSTSDPSDSGSSDNDGLSERVTRLEAKAVAFDNRAKIIEGSKDSLQDEMRTLGSRQVEPLRNRVLELECGKIGMETSIRSVESSVSLLQTQKANLQKIVSENGQNIIRLHYGLPIESDYPRLHALYQTPNPNGRASQTQDMTENAARAVDSAYQTALSTHLARTGSASAPPPYCDGVDQRE